MSGMKQISIHVTTDDWKLMRLEAATQRISISEMLRRWIKRNLDQLKIEGISEREE